MGTKKTPIQAALPTSKKSNPNAFEVKVSQDTTSQTLAKLITGSVLSGATLKQFSGADGDLKVADLVVEMKKAGDEAVAGDLGRVERMLANQLLTLDMLFNNLAQRSGRQDTFKGIEVLMRLALKAQAQARTTAETLSIIKNPMPYIRQANIAHGHQQVNNGQPSTGAGNFESEPNKLLEVDDGNVLDFGAQTASGRTDQELEAVGAVHRAKNARGKSDGGK
jgi:hypothetical protein